MGKFESYKEVDSLSDDAVTLFSVGGITRKLSFKTLIDTVVKTIKSNGLVKRITVGAGLSGGVITETGEVKCNLKSETKSILSSSEITTQANRQYAVGLDKDGHLSVNVPWDGGDSIKTDGSNAPQKLDLATKLSVNTLTVGTRNGAIGANTSTNGYSVKASGENSHGEGTRTSAEGEASHAEGVDTIAKSRGSHAEGIHTEALNYGSHAEGYVDDGTLGVDTANIEDGVSQYVNSSATQNISASGKGSHAEGHVEQGLIEIFDMESDNPEPTQKVVYGIIQANGSGAHAEGYAGDTRTKYNETYTPIVLASGTGAHAEGQNSVAIGQATHAEGFNTTVYGNYGHAEGNSTIVTQGAEAAHAEGNMTSAQGNYSHAEGDSTIADGLCSHAEGFQTSASGKYSHAEGYNSQAKGDYSHAEGNSQAKGDYSHTEGYNTETSGRYSHSGGYYATANGEYSFAHGERAKAKGELSIALGCNTTVEGVSQLGFSTVNDGNYHQNNLFNRKFRNSQISAGSFGIQPTGLYYKANATIAKKYTKYGSGGTIAPNITVTLNLDNAAIYILCIANYTPNVVNPNGGEMYIVTTSRETDTTKIGIPNITELTQGQCVSIDSTQSDTIKISAGENDELMFHLIRII